MSDKFFLDSNTNPDEFRVNSKKHASQKCWPLEINKMKTQIEIWNGGGWNNYSALKSLKSLPAGALGLASKQGISKIEISPRDSERPLGISARFFDDAGEIIFTRGFDQNASAELIRDSVHALLVEGVKNRIAARAAILRRDAFLHKITAWRRNFDVKFDGHKTKTFGKLINKFHAARRAAIDPARRPSRGLCTALAGRVSNGKCSFEAARAEIVAAGGKF
jgi:hypothetical protein